MESDSKGSGAPTAPRIVNAIDAATLARFYPKDAEKQGVEGVVTVAVTLDKEGRATDPQVLHEAPPDMGFGAAASSLAYSLTYSNPTGSPVVFRFAIKFALNAPRQSSARTTASRRE
jgi:TonB family protein